MATTFWGGPSAGSVMEAEASEGQGHAAGQTRECRQGWLPG